jgi:endonuclease G
MSRPELIIPYNAKFLGDDFVVPIPTLSDALLAASFANGAVLDYTHYSLIMHATRRVAIVTAHNVDASRSVRVKGGLTWRLDERAGEHQLGPETYHSNQLDKGHLVRREDVLWGSVSEAKLANKATYFYTNAAPQHQNFNQDEWVTLEDWVLDQATDFSYRLCIFTGPVLRNDDPVLTDLPPHLRTAIPATGPAQIPAAFWKVIVLRDTEAGGEDLSVVAFAMRQSEMWNDREGRRLLNLKVHQVTLEAIEGWTGLDFGDLKSADELGWSERRVRAVAAGEAPEWPQVRDASDIVYSGPSRRLQGLRVSRGGSGGRSAAKSYAGTRAAGDIHAASDCGCGDVSFDAREAVAALGREVARLTEIVAAQGRAREEPAPAPADTTRSAGPRSIAAAPQAAAGAKAMEDERVERMVAAAPDQLKDSVRVFARTVVMQHDIARGAIAVPPPSQLERIVGGNRVPAGGVPSCVCIGSATQWFCTGVVAAPRVVLTAAHCGAEITRILIGDQITPNIVGRVVAVRQAVIHPSYRRHPFNENDINVLILDAPAGIPPAPLATTTQVAAAATVHLVGFGYNDPTLPKGFGEKREVDVPMGPVKRSNADNLAQFEALTGFHADYEFVAGRKGLGKDSCNGDSGGPAYIDTGAGLAVAGLTSRATRDADVNCGAGGIYVRTDFFRDYVNSVLASNGLPALPA